MDAQITQDRATQWTMGRGAKDYGWMHKGLWADVQRTVGGFVGWSVSLFTCCPFFRQTWTNVCWKSTTAHSGVSTLLGVTAVHARKGTNCAATNGAVKVMSLLQERHNSPPNPALPCESRAIAYQPRFFWYPGLDEEGSKKDNTRPQKPDIENFESEYRNIVPGTA